MDELLWTNVRIGFSAVTVRSSPDVNPNPYFEYSREVDEDTISLKEDWTIENAPALESALSDIQGGSERPVVFQCGGLQDFDIAGAWIVFKKSRELQSAGYDTSFRGFKAKHFKFLKNVTEVRAATGPATVSDADTDAPGRLSKGIEAVGRRAASNVEDVGRIATAVFSGIVQPSRLAINETIRQIEHTGLRAVPIVSLVTFLMGVVLAYQGASQLTSFGAEVFVADLVTVSMVREMGVLLAGIMAAGRSGSAFAASIGVMKLNEEIDALRVMGLNPNQILIAPRVIALLIALPLLAVIGTGAGILGGLTLSSLALDMPVTQFLERAAAATDVNDVFVGIVKAPVFALIIAAVGTLRGIQVASSADQLGRMTTTAVVQSVFLIILADAVFTIIFVKLGI